MEPTKEHKEFLNNLKKEKEANQDRMKRIHSTPDIDAAIAFYNGKIRKDGQKRMTKKDIVSKVVPDKSTGLGIHYLSQWSKGKNLSAYRVRYGVLLCELTGYSLNELHNCKELNK